MNPKEQALRQALNIPVTAQKVIVFAQAAHMDWDWRNGFQYNVDESGTLTCETGYFNNECMPSNSILQAALNLLQTNPQYWYEVCEIGFLREFQQIAELKATKRLGIVGGGITSPDSLLPTGEAFFRNYHIGTMWLRSQNIPWSGKVWLPDDFGLDGQLPVMLQAMGAEAVGFSRIPGSGMQGYYPGKSTTVNKQMASTAAGMLLKQYDDDPGGATFQWLADDGSSVIGHWLEAHYNQGINIHCFSDNCNKDYISAKEVLLGSDSASGTATSSSERIQHYLSLNEPVSPTPYIYVHVSDDFRIPLTDLQDCISDWNKNPPIPGTYAVLATFAHYIDLVQAHVENAPGKLVTRRWTPDSGKGIRAFQPSPYWMGFYASRADLKYLHHQTTAALLGAETFQALGAILMKTDKSVIERETKALTAIWDNFVPSTHHDFVTGTAMDCVYNNEQQDILKQALEDAVEAEGAAITQIAKSVQTAASNLITFNKLGYPRNGLVTFSTGDLSQDAMGASWYQKDGFVDNQCLTVLDTAIPSLGYTALPTSQIPSPVNPARVQAGNEIVLSNNLVQATIGSDGFLKSIVDLANNQMILGKPISINFYNDEDGNIYRFAYEMQCDGFSLAQADWQVITAPHIVETGPVRASVQATLRATIAETKHDYTLIYSLVANEPLLRISIEGIAPSGYTVMIALPLKETISELAHGTPYHWASKKPAIFADSETENSLEKFVSVMEATHDYIVYQGSSRPLAAIYHQYLPCWGANNETAVGVLFRDASGSGCEDKGAYGSDTSSHRQEFAIRIPSNLSQPGTTALLRESRSFANPMTAQLRIPNPGGSLRSSASLGQINAGEAIITAAKFASEDASKLVFRIYQPTNTPEAITFRVPPIPGGPGRFNFLTALEQATDPRPYKATNVGNTLDFTAPYAVTTVQAQNN